jgi:hypothetical protein
VASTGSYKLKRYDLAIGFVGERFKEHFAGWGDKAFDEIEFRAVLETNTRVQGPIKGVGAHRHHPAVYGARQSPCLSAVLRCKQ